MNFITKTLQVRFAKASRRKTETEAQRFNKIMNTGKISSAIAKQTDASKGVLSLDEIVKGKTVEQTFIEKHPPSEHLMRTILHQFQTKQLLSVP